ncbi:MAG: ChbG/HpnK family deacetylase [Bacteroidota bacterium]
MRLTTVLALLAVLCLPPVAISQISGSAPGADAARPITLLIRCDDWGMCHAVNMAAKRAMESGIPISASVMFACPWYQEIVDLLKGHPDVSVGIHLTLNAEWKNYRWGPVSGASAVPSLVDSLGYFFPSRDLFFSHNPKLDEIERELLAQIERAVHSGLQIDYVDYHMGTAVQTPETRAIVERLASEYHLGISRYFGERDVDGFYATPPDRKRDTLIALTRNLPPDSVNLLVFHLGIDTPEMSALSDLNAFGLPEMSKYRQAELDALLSQPFQELVRNPRYRITTYRALKANPGLGSMRRPAAIE